MWGNIDYVQYSTVYILLLNKCHIEHWYIVCNIAINYITVLLCLIGLGPGMNIIKHNLP